MRRAKIVCTLGPATDEREAILSLLDAGMNVARQNFSHGTHDDHRRIFANVRAAAEERGVPVAVLQDLSGPKIRAGLMQGGKVELVAGEELTITTRQVEGTAELFSCSYEALPKDVEPKDRVLLSDGRLELEVLATSGDEVRCKVIVGGELGSRKGINLPGVKLSTPALTERATTPIIVA